MIFQQKEGILKVLPFGFDGFAINKRAGRNIGFINIEGDKNSKLNSNFILVTQVYEVQPIVRRLYMLAF